MNYTSMRNSYLAIAFSSFVVILGCDRNPPDNTLARVEKAVDASAPIAAGSAIANERSPLYAEATTANTTKSASHSPASSTGQAAASESAPSGTLHASQLWRNGQTDAAIEVLLDLSEQEAPTAAWQPYTLSEQEFTALSSVEQDRLKAEMLTTYGALRAAVKELLVRHRAAVERGDAATTARIHHTLVKLAEANEDSHLTKLANAWGLSVASAAKKVANPTQE